MAEYIKRTDAVKIAEKYGLANGSVLGRHTGLADCIATEISVLPAANVAPVRHGRWVDRIVDENEVIQPWMERYYCSECMRTVTVGNDFFGESPKSVSAAYPYDFCSYGERREE